MTLYLKYRPQTIEDLDLTSVREGLKRIINSNNLPHAFLFSGQKGTGKTSLARILAKIVNCEKNEKKLGEPCNKCDTCIAISKGNHSDIVEMDAASHRGIDDIRALKESVSLAPQSARKKIYIIDEAHMLTTEAANAFLKTLEEPPTHVLFILATTNPEKLPDTIHSRLTTINFTKATAAEVTRQLERVIRGEKFDVETEALAVIAQVCDGSFRDAVKTLEQLTTQFPKVTKEIASEYLLQTKLLQVDRLVELLQKHDGQGVLDEVERVAASGGSVKLYIDQISFSLHSMLLAKEKTKFSVPDLVALLSALQMARSSLVGANIAQLPLEIELMKWLYANEPKKVEEPNIKKLQTLPKVAEPIAEKQAKVEVPKPVQVAQTTDVVVSEMSPEIWQKLLTQVKAKNASIEALLRSSKPMQYDGNTLTLGVYYQFHKERLESVNNRKILEEVIVGVFGSPVRVACQLTQKPPDLVKSKETVLTDASAPDIIKAAKEIFG